MNAVDMSAESPGIVSLDGNGDNGLSKLIKNAMDDGFLSIRCLTGDSDKVLLACIGDEACPEMARKFLALSEVPAVGE